MDTQLSEARALPGYRLALEFLNGSFAIINLQQKIHTLRFARLAAPSVFATARAEGDCVAWSDRACTLRVSCQELLDMMLMG